MSTLEVVDRFAGLPLRWFQVLGGRSLLLVLDQDGRLLGSQDADDLKDDRGYWPERLTDFLDRWKA